MASQPSTGRGSGAPDPLAGRREDRVAQGRRHRRHPGLAHPPRGLLKSPGIRCTRISRGPSAIRAPVGLEVVLLHPAPLEADLSQGRDPDATTQAPSSARARGPVLTSAPRPRRCPPGGSQLALVVDPRPPPPPPRRSRSCSGRRRPARGPWAMRGPSEPRALRSPPRAASGLCPPDTAPGIRRGSRCRTGRPD